MKRVLSLPHRRLAVVAQLLSYPLIFLAYELSVDPLLRSFISLLAALLWLGAMGYLFYNTAIRQFGNAPDENLDERQNSVRNYAYRNAYISLSVVVMLCLFYTLLAIDKQWWLPSRLGQITSLFFTFLFLMVILPSAIIAWTEPEL